jgi:ATP-dependent DNA helicase RecQ
MNQPVNLNDFVLPVKQELIIKAIQKMGADSLTLLKEYLGESYSYEEIKLVRAWWRRER